MTKKQRTVALRFEKREQERLIKLVRVLGSHNTHEAEAARSKIDGLLRQFSKGWGDLIKLLGGTRSSVHTGIVRDITALGSNDPDVRTTARANLDDLIERHRRSWNDLVDELCSVSPAPWVSRPSDDDPERVNPLDLVHYLLKEYVSFREPHEFVAVALWALHTHVYRRFMVTPRLALRSPVAGCGKTVLLNILSRLAARAAKTDSITAAAIYHLVDALHPTLLIDEADNLGLALNPNGKLRAVFNSGYGATGSVDIFVMNKLVPGGYVRKFSTFAPLALALPDFMSNLPRTLNSRCITISMQRHHGQRELRRFDINDPDRVFDPAYGQILMWKRSLDQHPLNLDPEMPAGMRNRIADNWRPLIAVADSIDLMFEGSPWAGRAREAMVYFAREFQDADVRILLLNDIRTVFDAQKVDRLPSSVLLSALHDLDSADWRETRGIRGDQQPHKLKDSELATMLREFRIKPRSIWPLNRTAEDTSAKGYRREQFEEAWRLYCAEDGTAAQASNIRSLRRVDSGTV